MFYPMTMMMMFARSISFCCCCLSVFYSDCFHCIFSVCFVFGSTNQCRLCYKQSVLFIENYYQQKNKSSIDIVLEKIENNNIIKCISQVIWQYHHHPNHPILSWFISGKVYFLISEKIINQQKTGQIPN